MGLPVNLAASTSSAAQGAAEQVRDTWAWFVDSAIAWTPALVVVALTMLILFLVRRRAVRKPRQELVLLSLLKVTVVIIAIIGVALVLPVGESDRAQLLSLLGILLSATIALASTTFVGNAMAGLMLRGMRNFRPGDWVRVGEVFGRISETGLLHTEVQDSERNLTTLPNLHLVTHPVTVVRASGTFVSSTLSLGYDVSHQEVEAGLLSAAESAGLSQAFVLIEGLGDHAITYRVSGFLEEVRLLLSARSRLNAHILEVLHGRGIEIVSPIFVNPRSLSALTQVIPKRGIGPNPETPQATEQREVDEVVFDKAAKAEAEELLTERIAEVSQAVGDADDEFERATLKAELAELEAEREGGAEDAADPTPR